MPHKRFQTCNANGVIDAEIEEKDHLWTETKVPQEMSADKEPAAL
ncbi:MAG: hypothetical protein WCE56_19865 [Desulfobacterales bacterium]